MFLFSRQSPTGAGEFVFTTSQNIQIMHGITAMLNEAKRKHGLHVRKLSVQCIMYNRDSYNIYQIPVKISGKEKHYLTSIYHCYVLHDST